MSAFMSARHDPIRVTTPRNSSVPQVPVRSVPACYDGALMLKGFTHARLACGCRIAFREGVEGSPVTVVVDEKSPGCMLTLHVRDLPLYDYREALRPSTRLGPPEEEEYEEEG